MLLLKDHNFEAIAIFGAFFLLDSKTVGTSDTSQRLAIFVTQWCFFFSRFCLFVIRRNMHHNIFHGLCFFLIEYNVNTVLYIGNLTEI